MAKRRPIKPFLVVKGIVKFLYGKTKIIGTENLPEEPCLIVGNHSQMNGPVVGECFFPENTLIWCVGDMLHLKDVPAYAFSDFWSEKPRWQHPFFKVLSYIIAPLSVFIFNNAKTIGVYHDTRILTTFKATVKGLNEGKNIIIFPEHNKKHNHILYEYTKTFVDTARIYYKKTGKEVSFVPMYIAPKRRECWLGKPIKFDSQRPIDEERQRIRSYLMEESTKLAEALPLHTVIPYRNIPKRLYPKNKSEGANI